jgi:hypothetical protein
MEPLLDGLARADEPTARRIERALARAGRRAAVAAMARLDEAPVAMRARLVALVGRIAAKESDLAELLRARLSDPDAVTRRRAASALGKIGDAASEDALLALLARADGVTECKVVVEALGKIGAERSAAAIENVRSPDGELARVVREALAKIRRTSVRSEPSVIDATARPASAVRVLLHVRAGLERMLVSELGTLLQPRIVGVGRVGVRLAGALRTLFVARTFLHLGFPLAPEPAGDDAVALALASAESMRILRTFTRGPIRYRIEWADAGHRRAATYRVAEKVARAEPDLVNDPRGATWEAVVTVRRDRTHVELWPRGLADPRFGYRVRTVAASSHPTIAAALARLAGAQARDVVWDPFVGAGAELVERAKLGPYRALYGSDVDRDALAAARDNLDAAGVRATLSAGDARTFRPREPVTLLITNPPMGRRSLDRATLQPVLSEAFRSFARALAPHARIVWVAPPGVVIAGLRVLERIGVDMGGFDAEIQLCRVEP